MKNNIIFEQSSNISHLEKKILIETVEDMPFQIVNKSEDTNYPKVLIKKVSKKKSTMQTVYEISPICDKCKIIKKENSKFLVSEITHAFTKRGALITCIENKSKNLEDISYTKDFGSGKNSEYRFLLRI